MEGEDADVSEPDPLPFDARRIPGGPQVPGAPSAPGRPWPIMLGSALVCLIALLVLVFLANDGTRHVPPTWLFAASGIAVAGIGGLAVWIAASRSRLVSRSAIALGGGFACIGVAKFALAPSGFFDQTRDRTIQTVVGQQTMIVVAGLGVLALYVTAIILIRRIVRGRLGVAPKIRTPATVGVILGLVTIGAILPIIVFVAAGPFYYLDLVFTSVVGLAVTLVLVAATGLVTVSFDTAEDRAQILARASMLTTAAWIALAFVVLFQALWIVFMLMIVAVWPLRTVTPK